MLLNCILLALSVSIDSIGLGFIYGIKHTKINIMSNLIIFSISFCITCGSIFLGHYISIILSPTISSFLGSSFLIILGIYNIYKVFNNPTTNYDIDCSNDIDKQEALLLGLGLSIDAICVGLGSGIIGISDILLPILISSFQLIFLNLGNIISKKLLKKIKISENFFTMFSGIILILVGFLKISL